ncbi:MAG: hypothetical protein U9P72_05070 [Campylobacterota bacterium]|nr:hypothetical protein [Campylobacterota bacterium]
MAKVSIFILTLIFFTACVSREGISLKYHNECKEYYDMQGYYHKKCDDSMMLKYKTITDAFKEEKQESKNNVW